MAVNRDILQSCEHLQIEIDEKLRTLYQCCNEHNGTFPSSRQNLEILNCEILGLIQLLCTLREDLTWLLEYQDVQQILQEIRSTAEDQTRT